MSKKSLRFVMVLMLSTLFLLDVALSLPAKQELSAALRMRGSFSDFGRYSRGNEEKTIANNSPAETAIHAYRVDETLCSFDFASLWRVNRSIDPSSYYYFVHSSKSPPECA